jgi:curved DNA-binding protein CbpA
MKCIGAIDEFRKVKHAYEVVLNTESRSIYDRLGIFHYILVFSIRSTIVFVTICDIYIYHHYII